MISFLISGRARVYRQQNKKKPVKKFRENSEKNLPALETGIGLLTDANNVSLGGDEVLTHSSNHLLTHSLT
jgi:hypothetical protein